MAIVNLGVERLPDPLEQQYKQLQIEQLHKKLNPTTWQKIAQGIQDVRPILDPLMQVATGGLSGLIEGKLASKFADLSAGKVAQGYEQLGKSPEEAQGLSRMHPTIQNQYVREGFEPPPLPAEIFKERFPEGYKEIGKMPYKAQKNLIPALYRQRMQEKKGITEDAWKAYESTIGGPTALTKALRSQPVDVQKKAFYALTKPTSAKDKKYFPESYIKHLEKKIGGPTDVTEELRTAPYAVGKIVHDQLLKEINAVKKKERKRQVSISAFGSRVNKELGRIFQKNLFNQYSQADNDAMSQLSDMAYEDFDKYTSQGDSDTTAMNKAIRGMRGKITAPKKVESMKPVSGGFFSSPAPEAKRKNVEEARKEIAPLIQKGYIDQQDAAEQLLSNGYSQEEVFLITGTRDEVAKYFYNKANRNAKVAKKMAANAGFKDE